MSIRNPRDCDIYSTPNTSSMGRYEPGTYKIHVVTRNPLLNSTKTPAQGEIPHDSHMNPTSFPHHSHIMASRASRRRRRRLAVPAGGRRNSVPTQNSTTLLCAAGRTMSETTSRGLMCGANVQYALVLAQRSPDMLIKCSSNAHL